MMDWAERVTVSDTGIQDPLSDERMERLRQGDENALAEVRKLHTPWVATVICRHYPVFNESDVDDVLAVAVFRLWQGRHRLDRAKGQLPALFCRIALSNEFNGLLLSNGWKDHVGQCHWQLTRSGRMDLGVNLGPSAPYETIYRSSSLPEADDFGRWLHLAVVYDTAAKQVAFYADGRLVTVKSTADDTAPVLGPCEIGNWDAWTSHPFAVRNFRGRIDELMIFRRALTAAEVKTMYDNGKP